ncbi:MAG: hypothetical protein EON57_00635 [Alphaproteobacteria bacterium]|nr:MAG: hypothetical protein EON57_00635 [Alphaproteobacteria bacterium]
MVVLQAITAPKGESNDPEEVPGVEIHADDARVRTVETFHNFCDHTAQTTWCGTWNSGDGHNRNFGRSELEQNGQNANEEVSIGRCVSV